MKHRGLFVSFEGGEGCGKTTVVGYVVQRLRQANYEVVVKREPGGTNISEKIRNITHDLKNTEMSPRSEALLMAASRAQLIYEGYLPALETGEVIIADRYVDSSYAYQGYGRGLPLKELKQMMQFATQGLLPDRTFLFDLDPEIGYKRRAVDAREDRIETSGLAFFKKVRQGYLELAKAEPERFVVLDASQPLKQVSEAVFELIVELIHQRGGL